MSDPHFELNPSEQLTSNQPTPTPPPEAAVPDELIGRDIDEYHIVQRLGRGGMGVVYLAEQRKPIRMKVALKVIKRGLDTKDVIARFETERQALAIMNHPGICRVINAGETPDGRPYFVMEHVPGKPITQYCDDHKLAIRKRLELFAKVCEAVQHAHTKGIIHRDLSPSNVLVTELDGKAVPKVIDFGVAKALHQPLTDRTMISEAGRLIGKLEYMSPEQAGGEADIDALTDVYSLGVLLYELLAGAPPFPNELLFERGMDEMKRIIREEDPPTPSTFYSRPTDASRAAAARRAETVEHLASTLRQELEWIPLFAMRKERERRYQTAAQFATDIQNYLDGQPLIAGPATWGYRAKKTIRRNQPVFAAAAGIVLALILGMAGTTWQMVQARAAEAEALEAKRDADEQREIASNQLKLTERELARSNTTGQFFTGILRGVDPAQAPDYDDSLLMLMLSRAEERLRNEIHDPVERADLLRFLGDMHRRWGKHEEAGVLLADALEESQKAYDAASQDERIYNDHEVVRTLIAAYMQMSQWHLDSANPPAAEKDARAAHDLGLAQLPESHVQRAATAVNLSAVLQKMDQLEEAEQLLEDALAQMEADPARYRVPDRLLAMSNWTTLLLLMKHAGAEAAFAELVKAYREAGMSQAPAFANVLHNRAEMLRQQRRLDDALAACQEANEIRRAAHRDPTHIDLARGLDLLGNILIDLKRLDEAYAAWTEEFQIRAEHFSRGHGALAATAARTGRIAAQTGRTADAVIWYRRAVEHATADTAGTAEELERRRLGALRRLGEALTAAGQTSEAEKPLRDCLAGFSAMAARDNKQLNRHSVALSQLALATALAIELPPPPERVTEATSLLQSCLEFFEGLEGADVSAHSPDHRRAQELMKQLEQLANR